MFDFETSFSQIPAFWAEYYQSDMCKTVCGAFGVCLEAEDKDRFQYLIADLYQPWNEVPDGFETAVIPKQTWAVFSCRGPLPNALQEVNTKIFSEWLSNNNDYMVAGHYNIELYAPAKDYPLGIQDENYHTEIWISVKKKQL